MTLFRIAASIGCAILTLGAGAAHAQQVYRIVGPDGKVTYSDRAPETGASAASATDASADPSGGGANDTLPYALRQIAARFPVTLYTSKDCGPCDGARSLLTQRGVPFTEKTIGTNEDIAALQRLSGSNSLPFGSIGGQQLKGFSDTEWRQYLDAAGYPAQSQLPSNYQRPAATPLVAIAPKPAAPAAEEPAASAAPQQPASTRPAPQPAPSQANPAGIVF